MKKQNKSKNIGEKLFKAIGRTSLAVGSLTLAVAPIYAQESLFKQYGIPEFKDYKEKAIQVKQEWDTYNGNLMKMNSEYWFSLTYSLPDGSKVRERYHIPESLSARDDLGLENILDEFWKSSPSPSFYTFYDKDGKTVKTICDSNDDGLNGNEFSCFENAK